MFNIRNNANHSRKLLFALIITLIFLMLLLAGFQSIYAGGFSKFTLYITPVLPGIMLHLDTGSPLAYINANADIPLARFKISSQNIRRITIDLNTRFYIRQLQSVVDEYSLNAMYLALNAGLGSLYYSRSAHIYRRSSYLIFFYNDQFLI